MSKISTKECKEKEKKLKQLYKDRENVGSYGWAFDYDEKISKLENELEKELKL